ncbi:alanine--tRNA ligase [Marinivivus vitaminiproducens]|uniref:alanine--tRNA ligase n=1 Tax=Marinivivus vitaminiproducens TaxID=3035935 RepID=UPI0027A86247|nr:alanine--tRNA ligase [Geminicoccaceae bacterium SCSIO 64248]
MQSVNDIRSTFLDFFKTNNHAVVPSSPLVPHNDPTLLFTNSGMVQFKNLFTGLEKADYNRATTAQKCVRAGGKHNDLDNVGYTARHHTFFEMLGNFSFGDYFKEDAIHFAWTLITKEFGLAPEKLTATVYAEDDDAASLWRKIAGLPEERIIRIATSDNFWQMGDTGPCGPCSEIFYDHGPEIPGGPPGSPDEDGDRFVEIWNLVFMQFEQLPTGERMPLPRPSIDTGMGLERIATVLQGVHDNYDIDLFRRLIDASVSLTGVPAEGRNRASHRVIADHLRASSFLIADGVMPANDGRGYVLRRILRRGIRHAYMLGARDPLFYRLLPVLVAEMGAAYPELKRAESLIAEMLRLEETRFRATLERGLRLLEDETARLAPSAPLPGEAAFRLYDTYGFPLDLTQDALRAEGRSVDVAGFETAMAEQRRLARASWQGSGEQAEDRSWYELRERVGATEFLGYTTGAVDAVVTAIVKDGGSVDRADDGDEVAVLVNQTPFYGESGGQIGDTGTIASETGTVAVGDTRKKAGDVFVHSGRLSGTLKTGDVVHLAIDAARRTALRRAHSATHLLHAALRRHLGDHVAQKGSLVTPDRLRFDFSHHKPVEPAELRLIEQEVNAYLRQNGEVSIQIMDRDSAIQTGAMALFGEKYGDEVRVVRMGDQGAYSIELCGGTHVARTGDAALCKIVGEGAVASGIRRIEALTGPLALAHVEHEEDLLGAAAGTLRVTPADLPGRLAALVEERRSLERELSKLRQQLATGGGDAPQATRDVNGVTLAARKLGGVPAKDLRGLADTMLKQIGEGVVALVGTADGKAAIVVSVSDGLKDKVDAVGLVRLGVAELGGKGGGGRSDFAQGGGPNPDGADAALDAIASGLGELAPA